MAVERRKFTVRGFGENRGEWFAETTQPLDRFLEQTQSRKFRTVYSELFGGSKPRRVTSANLNKFNRTLRRYGYTCEPKQAGANDYVTIARNQALISRQRVNGEQPKQLPEELAKWLPGWNVAEAPDGSSRDPLGLMAGAEVLANSLLPGMTVFVSRAGYLFFLAWALGKLEQWDGRRREQLELLNRLERILVLCEAVHHGMDDLDECRHQGQRRKGILIREANDGYRADIPETILKNQANSGCYNLYRGAMVSCGFWEADDLRRAEGRLPYRLTNLGKELAKEFDKRAAAEHIWRWACRNDGAKRLVTLQEWGGELCFTTFSRKAEREHFLEGFVRPSGASAEVMRAASSRYATLRSLGRMALTAGRVSGTAIAGKLLPTRDGLTEYDGEDGNENFEWLMTYYEKRTRPGPEPFITAAVYELAALAANGIFKTMCEAARSGKRQSIDDWAKASTTTDKGWWSQSVATVRVRASERDLAASIMANEDTAAACMKMLLLVLRRADNQPYLEWEPLASTTLLGVMTTALAGSGSVRDCLKSLAGEFLRHHQRVSANKRKDIWLETDRGEFWSKDNPDTGMELQFHSFRFPQVHSIMRDLAVSLEDFNTDEC